MNSAKIAGTEWFHLGEIQREQYQTDAQAEWDEFRQKIKAYRENDGSAQWKETKKSLPRKMYARSPFAVYIKQNYADYAAKAMNESKKNKEIIAELAQQWERSDDDIKRPYRQQWAKEKEEFMQKYGKYLKATNDRK